MSEASPYMRRALALAERGVGLTSPNPAVGCVIAKEGRVIGEGFYGGPGTRHAEIAALSQAGAAARGTTAYVTLEPCSHAVTREGEPRTSCTRALIEAGVSRVVFAIEDADERNAGKGRAALAVAGVEVEEGDGAAEAGRLLEAYIKQRKTGLPFVVVKYAASLDGRIAAASGDSRWVSGPETLRWSHELRTKIDAIMVGVSTVLVDDPQLTARPEGKDAERQPLRIVADSDGRTPLGAKVLDGPAKTLIATTERSPYSWRDSMFLRKVEVLILPEGADGRVSLPDLLRELGKRGVLTLLVEGGGVLHGAFFDQRLVDKVHAVLAPMIIGAAKAPAAVSGRGGQRMADAVRLREITVERLGEDVLVTGYPVWPISVRE
jgi:diaminohydroxyphosphoribosylaminopyrimidine deaminase/5-amino-6-(5-phosphoribosylamino)uracil reductase